METSKKNKTLSVFTDGGSRGNPGTAAIGVYMEDNSSEVVSIGKRIGSQTNNYAEYSAVLAALNWLLEHREGLSKYKEIHFFLDSELVCFQLIGRYKVKAPVLASLLFTINEKRKELDLPIAFSHIPREKNKKADRMVNLALDNKI